MEPETTLQFNFPIYAVRQGPGYAAIVPAIASGQMERLVVVFTSEEKGRQFIEQQGRGGKLEAIADEHAFSVFLRGLPRHLKYIAFDPTRGHSPFNVAIASLL